MKYNINILMSSNINSDVNKSIFVKSKTEISNTHPLYLFISYNFNIVPY